MIYRFLRWLLERLFPVQTRLDQYVGRRGPSDG